MTRAVRITKQPRRTADNRGRSMCSIRVAALITALLVWLLAKAAPVSAQTEPPANGATQAADQSLSDRQEAITLRFQRFEKALLDMAEYMRKTDPQRADLLVRAIGQSKGDRIGEQMRQIVSLLEGRQLGDAVERQAELLDYLRNLLQLLQSEDRLSELDREEERIKDLLKDLGHLIAKEKDVRVATERRENIGRLIDRQGKVADEAGKLGDKIDAQDAERNATPERDQKEPGKSEDVPKPGENEPSEPGDQQDPNGKQPNKSEPQDGKPNPSQPNPGEQSEPGEQQPGQPDPSQSQPSQGSPQQSRQSPQSQQTPGREELKQAQEQLQQAIEQLEKQKHQDASKHQDEAIAQLQKAKEKLEEILRQLREEERELMLASLEARFQKMLEAEKSIRHETVGLAETPEKEWTSTHFGRVREVASKQNETAFECAKALTLLKEEGSSVAFPEAVEQVQHDMEMVARRLNNNDVGELTQGVETDIIEALEQMIEALQKEMEGKDQQQQQQAQQGQGEPQDPALLEAIAELKMLRSLQMRVNRRTKHFGDLIKGEYAEDAEVAGELQSLAERQAKIQQATYDLAAGKNK